MKVYNNIIILTTIYINDTILEFFEETMGRVFYKLKRKGDNWYVAFLEEESSNCTLISNNRDKLIKYLNSHHDDILVGANNFFSDDILLTSIIKNNDLTSDVTSHDISMYLPRTLDISQGIVRNYSVDFDMMLYSFGLPNNYAVLESDINKELVSVVFELRNMSIIEERNCFLNWKEHVIKEYDLPKEAYRASFGTLMEMIIGLKIKSDDKYPKGKKFVLDSKLALPASVIVKKKLFPSEVILYISVY